MNTMEQATTYRIVAVAPDGTERQGTALMGLPEDHIWMMHFRQWLGEVSGSPAVIVLDEDESLHAPADADPGAPCHQLDPGTVIEVDAGTGSRSIRQRLERTGYTVSPVPAEVAS